MAKDPSDDAREFIVPSPSVNPKTHAVNPSAPTTGTEGWGNTTDERAALSENPPSINRDGQTRKTGDNQPQPSSSSTATSTNVPREGRYRIFRCADAGNADCKWETSATSDDEIMEQARMHAQTEHGWNDWTDAMRNRVRDAIRERPAA